MYGESGYKLVGGPVITCHHPHVLTGENMTGPTCETDTSVTTPPTIPDRDCSCSHPRSSRSRQRCNEHASPLPRILQSVCRTRDGMQRARQSSLYPTKQTMSTCLPSSPLGEVGGDVLERQRCDRPAAATVAAAAAEPRDKERQWRWAQHGFRCGESKLAEPGGGGVCQAIWRYACSIQGPMDRH